MDLARWCTECGTPAAGTRFCTACGAALPERRPVSGWHPPLPAPPETDGGVATTALLAPGHAITSAVPAEAWPAGPPDASPRVTPRRTAANILAVLVVGALAMSAWALMHGAERHILSGTVLLVDSAYDGYSPGAYCTGSDGYSDIGAGTQVVLTDGKGTTLATTRLSEGEFDGKGCVFSFALHDVKHADFYALAVAGQNRGERQYSYGELAGDDWALQLSLGDD
jgi:hypothetical protein